ncbi:MAG: multicopper oxidase domain-containing protein [Thiogranum sp.]|nr:multicopper oxidase domain-containing protein [Thiogranum sp.]
MRTLFPGLLASLLCVTSLAASAITVTINPSKDNTVFGGAGFETNSCGAGPNVFSGLTADGFARRALLQFDVAGSVPAGSVIDSATLTLTITRTQAGGNSLMSLHALSRAWGEGTVNCDSVRQGGQGAPANDGDATWLSALHNQIAWTATGGDFGVASATASISSANNASAIWSSAGNPGMLGDLQNWLDNPAANFGWIMIGDESQTSTARRLNSREGNPAPVLTIDFTATSDVFSCCFADGVCSITGEANCIAAGGIPDAGSSTCSPNPCPQPTGACCNTDNSCSDGLARDVCESGGGSFQGGTSACSGPAVNCGLEPFVDALPIPAPVAPVGVRADGVPRYEITMSEVQQQLHRDLPPTTVWTYNGTYPGPTIEAVSGHPIEVKYINNLPVGGHELAVDSCPHGPNYWSDSSRTVTHLHGGHVPSRFDGQPEYDFMPGEFDVYEYPNNQEAATLWYHDHALGITRLNVYMGLAAYYLLRDDHENSLGLPDGEFEIPLAIQDREFNADGSLFYPAALEDGFFGDRVLVNGKVWPYLNVKQGKYRFRLLNGSQARSYALRLENVADPAQVIPFTLIGTDGGLIDAPLPLAALSMAPAERIDVVIDFSAFAPGTEILLRNDDGALPTLPNVMKFIVAGESGFSGTLPTLLRPVEPILETSAAGTRRFRLERVAEPCAGGEWLVQSLDTAGNVIGEHWDDITEYPVLGSTEIWEFENASAMMHPMHVHLVMFQVLDKTDLATGQPIALEPWEINTWKDTVKVPGNSKVRVIMQFEDYPGKFAYHCHILDHEDHEMMRQFQATFDPAGCNNDGICDAGEDCVSCAADCGKVSGASCGNGLCEAGDGENCVTCAADCAGQQTGGGKFCCGFDDGSVRGPIGCGVDAADSRCIDTATERFCRMMPRAQACCGDALCEGAEDSATCGADCLDTDADGFPNVVDSDTDNDGVPESADAFPLDVNEWLDSDADGIGNNADPDDDNDGLSDVDEAIADSDPLRVDSDGDGLVDGVDGLIPVSAVPGGVDANGDGFADGELNFGTSPILVDSDGDQLADGLEVANGSDPMDPASWPHLADADLAPLNNIDGQVNLGDYVAATRIAIGTVAAGPLQLAHGDMNGDNIIDVADLLIILRQHLLP